MQNFAQFESGQKTREIAADKAGFGNKDTYRQAKAVVEQGSPELVAAGQLKILHPERAGRYRPGG